MQRKHLNEHFLKQARKAKEEFQRHKASRRHPLTNRQEDRNAPNNSIQKEQKMKEPRTQTLARKTLYRQSIKLFYLI